MLQSETVYIDARPHQPGSTKTSCNARPDHTLGSKRESASFGLMSASASSYGHSARIGFGSLVPKPVVSRCSKAVFLLDHLVGGHLHDRRYRKAESLGSF